MAEKTKTISPLWLDLFEAKPNKMFAEEQRQAVRFLRYSQAVACAECGKRSKHHWSALYSFEALSLAAALVATESGKVHMPLSPVCRSHILRPAQISRVEPSNG
jgi:hypothetical protein